MFAYNQFIGCWSNVVVVVAVIVVVVVAVFVVVVAVVVVVVFRYILNQTNSYLKFSKVYLDLRVNF